LDRKGLVLIFSMIDATTNASCNLIYYKNAGNSSDNNDTIAEMTMTIINLLRMIFNRFSHSWFFRSTSEVLGAEWSNVTSTERPAWVCNRRVLSRVRCRGKKASEPSFAFSYYTHAITVTFRDTLSPFHRIVRRFDQSEGTKIFFPRLGLLGEPVWNVPASRGTGQRCWHWAR